MGWFEGNKEEIPHLECRMRWDILFPQILEAILHKFLWFLAITFYVCSFNAYKGIKNEDDACDACFQWSVDPPGVLGVPTYLVLINFESSNLQCKHQKNDTKLIWCLG